jgi:hypothetical protein
VEVILAGLVEVVEVLADLAAVAEALAVAEQAGVGK